MPKKRKPSKPLQTPAAKPKPHRATGKPRGRPEGTGFHPTDEQRAMVKAAAGYRIAEDEICKVVINPKTKRPISRTTLQQHFRDEIDQGYATLHIRIMAATVRNALGDIRQGPDGRTEVVREGNVTAQIWLQKTLYGARELVDLPAPPITAEADEMSEIEGARRVAFSMALGAHIVARKEKKKLPKPKDRPPL